MCLGFWLPLVLVLCFGFTGVLLMLLFAISWCFGVSRVCVLVLVVGFGCCADVSFVGFGGVSWWMTFLGGGFWCWVTWVCGFGVLHG